MVNPRGYAGDPEIITILVWLFTRGYAGDPYEGGNLKKGLTMWVEQLDGLYLKALDLLVLREQLPDIDKKRIAGIVRQTVSLDTIMRNEVFDSPFYNDSLFFLPVTARIEKLTHINETTQKAS